MLRTLYLTSVVAIAACGGGSTGAVTIDSDLTGVYRIDRYVGNQNGCDSPASTIAPDQFLVLYGFHPPTNLADVFLGGAFCGDIGTCQELAKTAPQPQIGYSFVVGDDASGWDGWAMLGGEVRGDQCLAVVQEHALTTVSGASQSVRIETRTIETATFAPIAQEGDEIECRVADAIAAVQGQPCLEILVLEASQKAKL